MIELLFLSISFQLYSYFSSKYLKNKKKTFLIIYSIVEEKKKQTIFQLYRIK